MRRILTQLCLMSLSGTTALAEKWPGVDDAVVQRIAREQGHAATKTFFSPEGDLQLFVFLVAGAVGGFVAGYYWRMLMEGKREKKED